MNTIDCPTASSAQPGVLSVAEAAGSAAGFPRRTFTPAASEMLEFSRLPRASQTEVLELLRVMKVIDCRADCESVHAACKAISASMQRRGFSASSLQDKYSRYMESGDWRELRNNLRSGREYWRLSGGADALALPFEFVQFWKALCESNKRKNKPAWRALIRMWKTREDAKHNVVTSIPGYAEWPKASPLTDYPAGWSYANLARMAPTKHELAGARIGRSAAKAMGLPVLTTRAGLKVGQFYEFDDEEIDLRVNFPGQRKAMRPLALHAFDLASASMIAHGFRPTLWDDVEGMRKKLTERDMLWLVVHVLINVGYRADEIGTILLVERGTAAIREWFAQRIESATGGRVTVERGGVDRRPAHLGQFRGVAKGNFRFKAGIESRFNLLRNEMAALPGQVGKDRLHAPEENPALERYNSQIIKAQELTEGRLRFPVLNWNDFILESLDMLKRVNDRTDHELEGWADYLTHEWRLTTEMPWLPQSQLLALPGPARMAAEGMIAVNNELRRMRKLSSGEVWSVGSRALTKLGFESVPILLPDDFAEVREVRKQMFTIENQEVSAEPLYFSAKVGSEWLENGSEWVTYLMPFEPITLVVCDRKVRFVGTCSRRPVPRRDDLDGVRRSMGEARNAEACVLAPLMARHAREATEMTEMHQHNAEMLGAGTAGERAEGRRIEERMRRRAAGVSVGMEEIEQEAGVSSKREDRPVDMEELSELGD
jgi:hypothetical protein